METDEVRGDKVFYFYLGTDESEDFEKLEIRYLPETENANQFFENNPNCYNTDSAKEAIEHFNIVIRKNKMTFPNKKDEAFDKLSLDYEEVTDFRTTLNSLLAEMPNSEALQNVILFPAWAPDTHYVAGERIRYDNTLYRVIQTHISQPDWLPNIVTSLFTPIILEAE